MKRAFPASLPRSFLLVLMSLLTFSRAIAFQDLLIESDVRRFSLQARQHDEQEYYRLSELATATGCKLVTQEHSAVVTGPAGTLHLTDGRALIRFNTEYILLSSAPWRAQGDEWYVAEDFVARALALVLETPLRPAGSRHYRLGSVSIGMELELVNRPDQVRLIFRPRQYTTISLIEYSDRIEVALGSGNIDVQLPPVQPNPRIVASISQSEDFLIIRKGSRYDRFEESQPMEGTEFIIDLFGIPSTILSLPRRRSTVGSLPSPTPQSWEDEQIGEGDSAQFDQLQDWRWGPIERRQCSVVIDPGHGGEDPGVTSANLLEKDIALEIAFRVQTILERAGRSCQLTRTRDVTLPIEQRSGVANYYQPDVFVSIHAGGAPSASTRSSAVYVDKPSREPPGRTALQKTPAERLIPWREAQENFRTQSARLGRIIQQRIGAIPENPTVFAEAPLAVLSAVSAPAILLEVGYLTNSFQREKLRSENHRELIASAIAEGILTFLQASTENRNTVEKNQ